MDGFIKVNEINGYGHIGEEWYIEDKSFMPKVLNIKTGNFMEWIPGSNGVFSKRAHVTTNKGRSTEIALDKVREAYEYRHPF